MASYIEGALIKDEKIVVTQVGCNNTSILGFKNCDFA